MAPTASRCWDVSRTPPSALNVGVVRTGFAILAAASLLAACGTRLPDSSFPTLGTTVVTTQQPGTVLGTATVAPTSSTSAAPGGGADTGGTTGVLPATSPGTGLTDGRPNTASD